MSRRSLLVRFVAASLGVVAIAFAAASIDDPVEPGGDGGSGGEGDPGPPIQDSPVDAPPPGAEVPAFLEYLALAAAVLAAIALAWYLITHRRRAVAMLAVAALAMLAVVVLMTILDSVDLGGTMNGTQSPADAPNGTGGEAGSGDGAGDAWPTGMLATILGLVGAVFLGALLLTRGDGRSGSGALADSPEERRDDAAAVGAAAGRAAERIEASEDESVDNEVYRAWREMTDRLEVDRPETSTPGEFADAAVESGLEREHVEELTRLFEDVRYGHAPTTEERERRAVAVLRRIESEYAGEATSVTEGDQP